MRYFVAILVLLVALPLAAQTPEPTAPTPTVEVGTVPVTAAPAAVPASEVETPVVADPAPAPAPVVDAVAPQLPDTAAAIPVPQTAAQAGTQAEDAISAFKVGQYVVGVLLLIGVAVFLYRKFGGPGGKK